MPSSLQDSLSGLRDRNRGAVPVCALYQLRRDSANLRLRFLPPKRRLNSPERIIMRRRTNSSNPFSISDLHPSPHASGVRGDGGEGGRTLALASHSPPHLNPLPQSGGKGDKVGNAAPQSPTRKAYDVLDQLGEPQCYKRSSCMRATAQLLVPNAEGEPFARPSPDVE